MYIYVQFQLNHITRKLVSCNCPIMHFSSLRGYLVCIPLDILCVTAETAIEGLSITSTLAPSIEAVELRNMTEEQDVLLCKN